MNETVSAQSAALESVDTFLAHFKSFLTWDKLFEAIGVAVVLLVLWIVQRLVLRSVRRANKEHAEKMTAHRSMVITRLVKYAYYVIAIVCLLSLLGVKLSAIWGAAGIAGVAIGFAAQTSMSNLISGVFILSEGTLKVGDLVTIGGETGTVDSVDLLSIKIHTLDNQLVRVPNSTVIDTNLRNTLFFPQRRMTISVTVSYDTDMQFALDTLKKAPALCPTVLADPEPRAWFDSFGEGGIGMSLAVWFKNENFLQTKNDTFIAIKKVCDDAGINIPFNRLYISAGDENAADKILPTAKNVKRRTSVRERKN